jgi:lysophospholipase L1-like esterase
MKALKALAGSFAFAVAISGCGGRVTASSTSTASPTPADPAPPKAPKVVLIGDSITYYMGQPSINPLYAQHPEWNDQGVIGQVSGQLMLRFADDVVSQHPAIAIILTGTNDVYPGWILCGGSEVFDTCDNIKAMVKMAQDAGIVPILATIPPWGPGITAEANDPSPARYPRIDDLNQWIQQYAFDNGLAVIDYHSALVDADGEHYKAGLSTDGVHPTTAGYAIMTLLAVDAIGWVERLGGLTPAGRPSPAATSSREELRLLRSGIVADES